MFESPGSIAFHIGGISVHWYGIIIAAAFITGLFVSSKIAEKQGVNPDNIFDLSFYLLFICIIFARLYFVLFNWQYYSAHLGEIMMIWQGGLSIHGAIVAGVASVFVYTKLKKISMLLYTDILSCGLILGQAIGRWGNFFNSEAFGLPTNLPWHVYIPIDKRPEAYINNSYFHPTFLYESIWDFLIFIILYFILRKKTECKKGVITYLYLILYSIGRFFIEGIRIDSIYNVFGLPLAQFMSLILFIIGIIGLIYVTFYKTQARHV